MTIGTIHPVATDLFLVEGREPVTSVVVLRRRSQVYLLDSGAGPEQRRSVRAVVASYGLLDALTLLSSSSAPLPGSNDDLVRELPARRRTHLRPRATDDAAVTSTSVSAQPYDVLGGSGWVQLGARRWPGWQIDDAGLQILRLCGHEGVAVQPSVVFRLPEQGLLVLAGGLARNADDAAGSPGLISTLAEHVRLISPGFGPLRAAADFRVA